ncbi:MAG: hypothetical protein D6683_16620 [Actinomyces sp.]|nr:MAG: hypothetical protein D6683_16620 [Actinomyces sp.]
MSPGARPRTRPRPRPGSDLAARALVAAGVTTTVIWAWLIAHTPTGRPYPGTSAAASRHLAVALTLAVGVGLVVQAATVRAARTAPTSPRHESLPARIQRRHHRLVGYLVWVLALPVSWRCLWALDVEGPATLAGLHVVAATTSVSALAAKLALVDRAGSAPLVATAGRVLAGAGLVTVVSGLALAT